ncbi:MAG: hypothetical protein L6W00_13160 [Lentisphaeria bacterium]|nr:MAG: hypothetical protein L6W00_13160 [Lentisphaeria bacterium]
MQKGWIDLRQWKQGGFQPERSTAILYNQFDSTTSGLMRVGFCADWYFDIYFNGKRILTRTGIKPFSPDNCFEDLIVKQGSNLLVAVVRAGSSGWGFGCGIPPFSHHFSGKFNVEEIPTDSSGNRIRQRPGFVWASGPAGREIGPVDNIGQGRTCLRKGTRQTGSSAGVQWYEKYFRDRR